MIFHLISKVFIHIHEYENLIICMSDNFVKELCLSIILEGQLAAEVSVIL